MATSTRMLVMTIGLVLSGASQAALIDRGGGLIYNDVLNVTWLADANYAKTTGYDSDGRMNWGDAMHWAETLSYYDSVRGVTYTDWRLPITDQFVSSGGGICVGVNCPGSEMEQLMYTEGSLTFSDSILASSILNSYFINMEVDAYWLGVPYTLRENTAWKFETTAGSGQGGSGVGNEFLAWAVRSGDVASHNNVPEPQTIALVCVALAGMALVAKQRRT